MTEVNGLSQDEFDSMEFGESTMSGSQDSAPEEELEEIVTGSDEPTQDTPERTSIPTKPTGSSNGTSSRPREEYRNSSTVRVIKYNGRGPIPVLRSRSKILKAGTYTMGDEVVTLGDGDYRSYNQLVGKK